MAIEGLRSPDQAPNPPVFISDEIGIATSIVVDYLGLHPDRDYVQEQMQAEFTMANIIALDELDIEGDTVLALPPSLVTLERMIEVMNGATYPYGRWYPKTTLDEGWRLATAAGQGSDMWLPHARVIIPSADSPYDSRLHFLNLPFDKHKDYAPACLPVRPLTELERIMTGTNEGDAEPETQLEALTKARRTYESIYPDRNMYPLNSMGIVYLSLRNRLLGLEMPLVEGNMRDATLPRVELKGRNWVPFVGNYSGSEVFSTADLGSPKVDYGVGLWVGQSQEPIET